MPKMTGHLRKGQNRPALTGRAARRHEARAKARALARKHRMPVITHVHRALVAAHNTGLLLAEQFLTDLTGDRQFAAKYGSAFGKACRAEYKRNHGDAEPAGDGLCIAGGRIRSAHSYSNDLDLVAGALAYKRTAHLVSVPAAVVVETNAEPVTAADNPQDIQAGDSVRLTISESPNAVSGTVVRAYRNAADILVADVEIRPGDVRTQNVKFLTKTADGPSVRKPALLDRWHDADAALRRHQVEHPVCAFAGQRWGCPDWRALNTAMDEIEAQMMDAGMPSPNAEIYAGDAGAAEFYADLV